VSYTIDDVMVELAIIKGQLMLLTAGPAAPAAAPARKSNPGELPTVFPNYGRTKGQPIAGAPAGDLEFYIKGAKRSLGDPSKARFHDKEQALLTALENELAAQNGAPPEPTGGPTGDDDIPF